MEQEEIVILKNQDDLLKAIDEGIGFLLALKVDDIHDIETTVSNIVKTINEFQLSPQLLDKKLTSMVERLLGCYILQLRTASLSNSIVDGVCVLIYNLCKVRGNKLVSTLFPTDISLFNILITRIVEILGEGLKRWHEISVLLLWMSVLVLSPFELDALTDSTVLNDVSMKILKGETGNGGSGYIEGVNALMFSKFLTRRDCVQYKRRYFLEYLLQWKQFSLRETLANLAILLKILKLGDSEYLELHYALICEKFKTVESPLEMQLIIKNYGHIAMQFIKCVNKGVSEAKEAEYLQNIEDIIGNMLTLTDNRHTVVRYSNAKYLSRISVCLPQDMFMEIFGTLIDQLDLLVNFDLVSVSRYHGVFVTIAELFKSSLLSSPLTIRLIFDIIKPFFQFKVKQMNTLINGTNIRDSVIYVVWNLLKYNQPVILANPEMTVEIFYNLLLVTCFDHDLIIRRCAAATVQELIGRYGSLVWSYLNLDPSVSSVRLVELLEFNKLNDFKTTFLVHSMVLSRLIPQLKPVLLNYLLSTEAGLLDIEFSTKQLKYNSVIRNGIFSIDNDTKLYSCLLLSQMLELNFHASTVLEVIQYVFSTMEKTEILNLLPVAQLLKLLQRSTTNVTSGQEAFSNSASAGTQIIIEKLKLVIQSIGYDSHKDDLFEGYEILSLITVLLPHYSSQDATTILDLVFKIIRQTHEKIDLAFQEFLLQLSDCPIIHDFEFSCLLEKKLSYYLKNGNATTSQNIGYLDVSFLLKHKFLDLIGSLLQNKRLSHETRVNLLASTGVIIKTATRDRLPKKFFEVIIRQLDDYTISEQGDIGNKVRYEALEVIEINLEVFKAFRSLTEPKLLRLSSELIDRIKHRSVKLLLRIKGESALLVQCSQVIEQNDYFLYYNWLLEMFRNEYMSDPNMSQELSMEFVKGLILSIGVTSGNNTSSYKSINSLISFFDVKLNHEKHLKLAFLKNLISHLGDQERHLNYNLQKNSIYDLSDKVRACCLNLIGKLVDGEVNLVDLADVSELKVLYVRVYNIEIRSKSVQNLANIVKVYRYIYEMGILHTEVMGRLKKMVVRFSRNESLMIRVLETLRVIYANTDSLKFSVMLNYIENLDIKLIIADVQTKKEMLFLKE